MTDFANTPTVISVTVFLNKKGNKMQKILIMFSIALISFNPASAAFQGFGIDNACYVETHKRNSFWFCGTQEAKCTGRTMGKNHNRQWQYHGESFSHDGKTYYCCNGTRTEKGYYVEASEWETSETITVQLANGGTCTYVQTTNACGEISGEPCTTPTDCTAPYIKRNGVCIEPCGATDSNMAYENKTSNTCIECKTTESQGIDTIDNEKICVKCNSTTEVWDAKTKKCVSRAEMAQKYHQISSATMKRCWQCPNNETFKTCAIILSLPDTDQQKHPQYTTTMQDCKITGQ